MARRLITDLDIRLVEASKSILLEIMTILGAYRESLVLVGGWAPYFIIQNFKPADDNFVHAGSLDVDIAVNPKKVSEVEYKSMLKLIEERGYSHSLDKEGIVLGARYSEKDAYDIYSLVSHYKEGLRSAAESIEPYLKNKLVSECIENIREKFKTKSSTGPQWIADFLVGGEEALSEERERIVTNSYMQVNEFLSLLSK